MIKSALSHLFKLLNMKITSSFNHFDFNRFAQINISILVILSGLLLSSCGSSSKNSNTSLIAENDQFNILINSNTDITTLDVLNNDIGEEGQAFIVTNIEAPLQGTAEILANGNISYQLNKDFTGSSDNFVYTITDDNGATASASVNLIFNFAPVTEEDIVEVDEDSGMVEINLLENDTDPNDESISLISISQPDHGTTSIVNNKVEYTPDTGFSGTDSFIYTINNISGNFANGTVNITVNPVNHAPIANDDQFTTNEDQNIEINVLNNDVDSDNDSLTVEIQLPSSHGTLFTLNNIITYQPDDNYNGEDSFTYLISDTQGGTDSASVTITINEVNDAPIATNDREQVINDNLTSFNIAVLINDSDIDNEFLSIDNITQPQNGVTVIDGTEISYTPDNSFTGPDSFEYTITDGEFTATATVNLIVLVPDINNPVAYDDSITINEDSSPTEIDVLSNDAENENDASNTSLTLGIIVGQPLSGSAIIDNNKIIYTPDADFNGTDSFIYTVSNASDLIAAATVIVTVEPINDAPIANDILIKIINDLTSPYQLNVLSNDSDIDGDMLIIASITQPVNGIAVIDGNSISYTPDPEFNGYDSFEYTVTDNLGGSASAIVNLIITQPDSNQENKDISYGSFDKNKFDLYLPDAETFPNPPLAIFIHGGGFKSGDKSQINDSDTLDELLAAGIAVVAANYRSVTLDNVTLDIIMKEDLTLLVQFLRSQASELGYNADVIAAYGNSAGAGAALWMGVHDDIADLSDVNLVKQQSSKVQIVGFLAGQSTYDTNLWAGIVNVNPMWMDQTDFSDDLDWFGVETRNELNSSSIVAIMKQDIDLLGLIDADDAIIYAESYSLDTTIVLNDNLTDEEKKDASNKIEHSPKHVTAIQARCLDTGLFCEVYTFDFETNNQKGNMVQFFIDHLLP